MELISGLNVSGTRLFIYYILVFIAGMYTLYRFHLTKYTLFVVLLFWIGFFDYLEYIGRFNANILKIILFGYAVVLWGKSIFVKGYQHDWNINLLFVLFSLSYWVSFLLHPHDGLTVTSQYAMKYAFPFLAYHGMKGISYHPIKPLQLSRLLLFIIFIQVILSLLKFFIMGGLMECIVGSIQLIGGGTAVTLPILAIFLIWLSCRGKLQKKDWFLAISVLLIALVSAKRTPIFTFPLFIGLLFIVAKENKKLLNLIKYIPLGIILLYAGVRANYSLNPDGKVWGKFDPGYAYRYALIYNFGTDDLLHPPRVTAGRGGSLLMLFHPQSMNLNTTKRLLFGNGVSQVVTSQNGRFVGGDAYHIQHKGLMGAFTMEVYKLGYMGALSYLLFMLSIIHTIRQYKFRLVMVIWFIIDYFLYYGSISFQPALAFLFIFIISYSNSTSRFIYYPINSSHLNDKKQSPPFL